jgi:hypothetical protein
MLCVHKKVEILLIFTSIIGGKMMMAVVQEVLNGMPIYGWMAIYLLAWNTKITITYQN